jgi:hypothetical protein
MKGQGKKPSAGPFLAPFTWPGALTCFLAFVILADPASLMRCTAVSLPPLLPSNSIPEEKDSEDTGKPVLSISGGRQLARKRSASQAPQKDLASPCPHRTLPAPIGFRSFTHLPECALSAGAIVPLRC